MLEIPREREREREKTFQMEEEEGEGSSRPSAVSIHEVMPAALALPSGSVQEPLTAFCFPVQHPGWSVSLHGRELCLNVLSHCTLLQSALLTSRITPNKIERGFNFSFPLSLDALSFLLRASLRVRARRKSFSVAQRMNDALLSGGSVLEGLKWHSEEAISHNI